jgi:BlaI family penicillinase repressor
MKEQQQIKATEAELEILNILWAKGPATVRAVHEELAQTKDAGYTTTLKLMQNMLEKKLVSRDATSKTHIYTALANQEETKGQIVQRMIERVFNGSAMQLVAQALGNHKTSAAELELIRTYLEKKKGNSE